MDYTRKELMLEIAYYEIGEAVSLIPDTEQAYKMRLALERVVESMTYPMLD